MARAPNTSGGGEGSSRLAQSERMGRLTTPLGQDKLVLTRFDVYEAMGELFEIRVDALSEKEDLDFDGALGRTCTVTYESYNGIKRYYSGVLAEAQWIGVSDGAYAYRLVLRPWLWLLAKATNCRIFKNKTVMDIIKQVFQEHGYGDDHFKNKVTRDSEALEYCVQYRETDFAFVSRLMEEYG